MRFYGQSFAHINEQCAFARAIETPMWTWVEYPLLPWSHVAAPPAEIRLKAAKALANGGRPMVWSVPRSPDSDKRGLQGIADVFALAGRFPEYFNGAEHVPFLGVLYSSQTMEEYSAGDKAKFDECQKEFSGVLTLARHNHLPADVLLDGHVTLDRLSRYRVLVLPNAAALSNEHCRVVAGFVQAGGGLIATFESSLSDERGERRPDLGLAEVLGVSRPTELGLQNERWSTGYSRVEGVHAVTASLGPDFRLPAGGRHIGVMLQGNAIALSTLLARCRYYCDYPGMPTEFPGLVANTFGLGRTLYIPGQFGLTYAERGFPDYRAVFQHAVEWTARGELPIRATLPDTVEVTVARPKAREIVVHLVNGSADLTRPVEHVIPVSGGEIRVRMPMARPCHARALQAGAELSVRREGDYLNVALPTLHEYEVVVVGPA